MELLTKHPWPGNVRELKNLVTNVAGRAPIPIIRPVDLPARLREAGGHRAPLKTSAEQQRELLLEALRRCFYNKAETARALGISRTTVYTRMRKYGICQGEMS